MSGCLLMRPAAQQLLGKVGLLCTAAATGLSSVQRLQRPDKRDCATVLATEFPAHYQNLGLNLFLPEHRLVMKALLRASGPLAHR